MVIGPEKLPGLAKTIGTLLGRARRYVADVKDEVKRSMDLDELKKMRETVEGAARDVEKSVQTSASDFERTWAETTTMASTGSAGNSYDRFPTYRHPGKKWRVKLGSTPKWYKVSAGVRTQAQSGAARVARFRPPKNNR